jgi:hypothetical protein
MAAVTHRLSHRPRWAIYERRTCRAVRLVRPIGARCRRPHRVGRALAQLGFGERCEPNSQTAAAVAHIVLEAIEDRLPCLGLLERRRTDLRPKVSRAGSEAATAGGASPEFTLAIDWTMSAPGFSWPVSYHLVWTPIYERFVVTASADCPDAFGYADFVLGKAQTNQGNFCRTRSVNAPSSRKRSLMAA